MYAQLGTTVFDGLKSFVTFSSQEEMSIVEHALINRKPRLQGAGIGLVNISLTLFLHQEFCVVKDEIANLRSSMETYEALSLLWGNGNVEGNFVIESLNVDAVTQDTLGNTIAAAVALSLKEYVVEDAQDTSQQQAQQNAFATGDKQPATKSKRVNPPTCNGSVSTGMGKINSNGSKVNSSLGSYHPGNTANFLTLSCIAVIKAETDLMVTKAGSPSYPCINGNAGVIAAGNKIVPACDYLTATINKGEANPANADKLSIDLYNASLQSGIKDMNTAVTANIKSNAIRK